MFLHMLAQSAPSQTIIEVGALGGYSAAWLAAAIRSQEPPRCVLHTIERDSARAAFTRQNLADAGFGPLVNVLNEPALTALPKLCQLLPRESVGLVFLDAKKSEYPAYFQMLEDFVAPVGTARRPLHSARRGLMIAHRGGGWLLTTAWAQGAFGSI
jgi:predicted O-methyltransferase YrrM